MTTTVLSDEAFLQRIEAATARYHHENGPPTPGGFAAPERCPPMGHMRTIAAALECALKIEAWDCVEDAYVMTDLFIKRWEKTFGIETLDDDPGPQLELL